MVTNKSIILQLKYIYWSLYLSRFYGVWLSQIFKGYIFSICTLNQSNNIYLIPFDVEQCGAINKWEWEQQLKWFKEMCFSSCTWIWFWCMCDVTFYGYSLKEADMVDSKWKRENWCDVLYLHYEHFSTLFQITNSSRFDVACFHCLFLAFSCCISLSVLWCRIRLFFCHCLCCIEVQLQKIFMQSDVL